MSRTYAKIKPSCLCDFPFCESSLTHNSYGAIYGVSIFTKQGFMLFTNRMVIKDGYLDEVDDLGLRCVRCSNTAEWVNGGSNDHK